MCNSWEQQLIFPFVFLEVPFLRFYLITQFVNDYFPIGI